MSEAAVAETTEEQVVTQPEIEAENTGAISEKTAATPEQGSGTEPEAGGTDTEAIQADDAQAALKEVFGKIEAPAGEKPDLPGQAKQAAAEELSQRRAFTYARSLLPEAQQTNARFLTAAPAEGGLGLSDEEAGLVFEKVVKPLMNRQHAYNEDFNYAAMDLAIKGAVSPELAKALEERTFQTRDERIAGIEALAREQENAKWQAKIEAGDYLSRKDAEAKGVEMFSRGQKQREKVANSTRSGNTVEGSGNSGSREWTYERYMKATPEERRSLSPETEARIIRTQSQRQVAASRA